MPITSITTKNYLIALLLGLFMFAFAGCETIDSPYARGEISALGALIAFDSDSDVEKLKATRDEILEFLASGESLTEAVLTHYAVRLAERYGKNQGAVRIVLHRLKAELSLENAGTNTTEFLRGVADTLSIALD